MEICLDVVVAEVDRGNLGKGVSGERNLTIHG